MSWNNQLKEKAKILFQRLGLYGILIICVLLFCFYLFFFQTPRNFKPDSTIKIEAGQSVYSVTREMTKEGIINSSFWLTNLIILTGGEHRVVAGYYLFQSPENLFTIAHRITHGKFGIVQIKVTIPEGLNVSEIADIYKQKFNLFDEEGFLSLAKPKEGYLFPETYFFIPTVTPAEVVTMMSTTFNQKIAPLEPALATSSHSLNEIITMASILEGEAKTVEDKKIVSGILWQWLADGVALGVDSTFKYINGKSSAELTAADLKTKSPYNTYLNRGLPPTPISNPGLESIEAALNPTITDYYYFLSDKEGNIHYAKTLKEHLANIKKYL